MTLPTFIDIETVPGAVDWEEVPTRTEDIFMRKFQHEIGDDFKWGEMWKAKAGLLAEFGKIVCVSIGMYSKTNDQLRIKTIAPHGLKADVSNPDEWVLLNTLAGILKPETILCAHNGKEFDFPFLQRRYLANDIELPACLNLFGKKPWEIPHLDTMDMWKFGQYKYSASLESLANLFGLPSPKKDMDGSMVAEVYYEPCPSDVLPFDHDEKKMKRIGEYCAGDIVTLANVFCKIKRLPIIKPEQVVYV